jgi:hypothetical protein
MIYAHLSAIGIAEMAKFAGAKEMIAALELDRQETES